jgi:probable metal-binding protein
MQDSVHGHEVLELVLAAPQPLTLEALEEQVGARFGAEARFHTCSASGLSFRELVDFLHLRGKLVPAAGGVAADRSRICEH